MKKLTKYDIGTFRERAAYHFKNDSKQVLDDESDFRMKCFLKAAHELFKNKGINCETASNILFDERSSDLSSIDD